MPLSPSEIEQLVRFPRESLNVELKPWLDISEPIGKIRILRALFAMRNQNGGFVLIGFNNSGAPHLAPSWDPRERFHPDNVHPLISRHASELFEVFVHFVELGGVPHPALEVEGGFRHPVAVKLELKAQGDPGLLANDVYVRSLQANGRVSSTKIGWKGWPAFIHRCLENHEADIGGFLRRHVPSLALELARALQDGRAPAVTPSTPGPTLEERVESVLEQGSARFVAIVAQRSVERSEQLPAHGSWEVGAVIDGDLPIYPLPEFRQSILPANPNYTGWPVWLDSSRFRDVSTHPYVHNGAWEAFIFSQQNGVQDHLDFWRLAQTGTFYLRRALQDDLRRAAPADPKTLDFGLVVLRVAEAIAVAIPFARALNCLPSTSLGMGFRWRGLRDRELSSWANPSRYLSGSRVAHQDQVSTFVTLSVETPPEALAAVVSAATQDLFAVFDGFQLSSRVIEDLTHRLLNRQL